MSFVSVIPSHPTGSAVFVRWRVTPMGRTRLALPCFLTPRRLPYSPTHLPTHPTTSAVLSSRRGAIWCLSLLRDGPFLPTPVLSLFETRCIVTINITAVERVGLSTFVCSIGFDCPTRVNQQPFAHSSASINALTHSDCCSTIAQVVVRTVISQSPRSSLHIRTESRTNPPTPLVPLFFVLARWGNPPVSLSFL